MLHPYFVACKYGCWACHYKLDELYTNYPLKVASSSLSVTLDRICKLLHVDVEASRICETDYPFDEYEYSLRQNSLHLNVNSTKISETAFNYDLRQKHFSWPSYCKNRGKSGKKLM